MTEIIGRSSQQRISANSTVTLHFSLLLDDGHELDTTRNSEPATFSMGDGSLLPGFEEVLIGMVAGDASQIVVKAAQAFGEHNDGNVQLIRRDRFSGIDLEKGLIVSFEAPDGELPGVVMDLFEETVRVDFNHPLAGKDITFDVAITEVVSSTETT